MALQNKLRSNRGAKLVAYRYAEHGILADTQPNSGADSRWPGDIISQFDLSEYKTGKTVNVAGDGILYVKLADWQQIVREAASVGLPPALHYRHYHDTHVWTFFPWDYGQFSDALHLDGVTRKGNVRIALGVLIPGVTVFVPSWNAGFTDLDTYLDYLSRKYTSLEVAT